MNAYRPDRVVRTLTTLASIVYFTSLALGALVLVGLPALKLFAGADPDWVIGQTVPGVDVHSAATVHTPWGEALLEVEDVRGSLELPIYMLPWWLFALLWVQLAAVFALLLGFLHHLRRIFQRVRDGAPFDAENALRLRRLGLLMLSIAIVEAVAGSVTALLVRRGLVGGDITVPTVLHVDASLVLAALVLMALAEIFRRGAELEDEQALVV